MIRGTGGHDSISRSSCFSQVNSDVDGEDQKVFAVFLHVFSVVPNKYDTQLKIKHGRQGGREGGREGGAGV